MSPIRIVGIGGTDRPGSSTEKALRLSLVAAERLGAKTTAFTGATLMMPMYSPNAERSVASCDLIEALRQADGIIIASPSYHGSISGLVKNALDYVEDIKGPDRTYFDGMPVGLIACAAGWQGAVQTLATLRSITHALRGWPTPLGVAINTAGPVFAADGSCTDMSVKLQLEAIGRQVVEFLAMRSAPERQAAALGG
ncbi:NADPH-dependent FMN reductase [Tianweitania sediminis]|uniref:NAD(P)H-dependent oxidoreductase n=1 Tax=Tianweitania sediminis TaxID=1502156 RepID=A0A8J7R5Q1_9HYPH|nr:NAD(P)H-dependent oxidoreductase [Tianweitania sediminis]MBP0441436.1 NAD(P)H-dependent oxidoreductase [Tianweitania sediminis]